VGSTAGLLNQAYISGQHPMTLSQPYSLYTTAAWLKIGDGAAAAKKLLCHIMAMIKTGKYGIHHSSINGGILWDNNGYNV